MSGDEFRIPFVGQERNGKCDFKGTFYLPFPALRSLTQLLHINALEGSSGLSAAEREIEMDWTSTIANLPLIQRTQRGSEQQTGMHRDTEVF